MSADSRKAERQRQAWAVRDAQMAAHDGQKVERQRQAWAVRDVPKQEVPMLATWIPGPPTQTGTFWVRTEGKDGHGSVEFVEVDERSIHMMDADKLLKEFGLVQAGRMLLESPKTLWVLTSTAQRASYTRVDQLWEITHHISVERPLWNLE